MFRIIYFTPAEYENKYFVSRIQRNYSLSSDTVSTLFAEFDEHLCFSVNKQKYSSISNFRFLHDKEEERLGNWQFTFMCLSEGGWMISPDEQRDLHGY